MHTPPLVRPCRRGHRRTIPLLICLVGLLSVAFPASAFANADEWLTDGPLSAGQGTTTYPTYYTGVTQTQTWNTDAKGIGNCTGVDNLQLQWDVYHCTNTVSSGIDESYCQGELCLGIYYDTFSFDVYAGASNHSGYNSVFTAWLNWDV